MARILLLRHAPTPETGVRLTGRAPGVSLGEEGAAAAQRTADRLAELTVRAVFTSPIERTLETARIVADRHGLQPTVEEGLTEMDFGSWTGRTLKSLRRTKLWGVVQNAPSRARFPEGESFVEAQTRAVAAVERIASGAGRGTAVAVSHADVIKLILTYYLGQPLDLFQRLVIHPASASEVILGSGPPMVGFVNRMGVGGVD